MCRSTRRAHSWWLDRTEFEFKRDLDRYLSRLPANAPMKNLDDIVAYNNGHSQVALKFGQTLALASQAKDLAPGSADTAKYQSDRAQILSIARYASTRSWRPTISAPCFSRIVAAPESERERATRPSASRRIPGQYRRPFNISLLGQAYTEPTLVGYAYDYEQATSCASRPR